MSFLIDQIDSSGLFAQSAYSASIATKDSNGNVITATYLTAHQDISNKLDISSFSSVSGDFATTGDLQNYATTSYVNNINTAIRNDMGTIATNTANNYSAITSTSSFLSGAVDTKLDTSSFEQISGSFYTNDNPSGFITGVDLSNYYTKSETSGASELADAFSNIPAGDPEVNSAVKTNSATWNDVTNKLDTTAFSTVSGTFLTAHQDLSNYATTSTVATISSDLDSLEETVANFGSYKIVNGSTTADITDPSTKIIYLIQTTATGSDIYEEWICTDTSIPSYVMIGDTTVDLSDYVTETDLESTSATITAMIPSTAGLATETDLQIVSGGVDYISGVALTSVDLTPYLTTATYAADSGTFATTSMLNDYQTTAGMTAYASTGDISGTQWNSNYETVNTNSGVWNESYSTLTNNSSTWNNVTNKLDTTAFSDVSGTFLTAHQSLDDYATKNYVQTNSAEITAMIPTDYYPNNNPSGFISGVDLTPYQTTAGMTAYATTGDVSGTEWNDCYETVQTNSASWAGGSTYTGDAQGALDEVYSNSGDWNDVYTTVYNNSGSWTGGGGGSIDTIPFIVQSPLTTGISGYSAYIGLDGEAFESSAYVPFSALTDNDMYDGYVHLINGSGVYAVDASHSNYADYAYYDSNGNDLATTRYYADEAYNTVQSNSANWSGGGSTPVSGLELSAGNYITIVDDIPNSASIISVTGLATTGDLNYVSGVVGDVESLLAQL